MNDGQVSVSGDASKKPAYLFRSERLDELARLDDAQLPGAAREPSPSSRSIQNRYRRRAVVSRRLIDFGAAVAVRCAAMNCSRSDAVSSRRERSLDRIQR
jgi:hypothetical protein